MKLETVTEYANAEHGTIVSSDNDEYLYKLANGRWVSNQSRWFWYLPNTLRGVSRTVIEVAPLGERVAPYVLDFLPVGATVDTGRNTYTKGMYDDWVTERNPNHPYLARDFTSTVTLVDIVAPTAEVTPETHDRGQTEVRYKVNRASHTVVICNPKETENYVGQVVELDNGRWLAVPARQPRNFPTKEEAVKWLL